MVAVTWGDWFVRDEIERSTPDGLSVWYLGCNGFVIRSPTTTIYLDPYFGTGDPPRLVRMIPIPLDPNDATVCDAVLATHEHIDHMHPPSYAPLAEDLGADVYAPESAYETPDYDGDLAIPTDQENHVDVGDTIDIGDVTVHVRGANDPDSDGPVSYVVEHDAGTFFHGGDSRPADAFRDIGTEFDIDLGVLAMGTVGNICYPDDGEVRPTRWYNDENQVIEAANALQLDRLAPSHYDMWKGVSGDPKVLHEHAASFAYPRTVDVIQIGDRLDVSRPGVVQPTSWSR